MGPAQKIPVVPQTSSCAALSPRQPIRPIALCTSQIPKWESPSWPCPDCRDEWTTRLANQQHALVTTSMQPSQRETNRTNSVTQRNEATAGRPEVRRCPELELTPDPDSWAIRVIAIRLDAMRYHSRLENSATTVPTTKPPSPTVTAFPTYLRY